MKTRSVRILAALLVLVFLGLTILAAVNVHRLRSLDLPISGFAAALSVILPLLQTFVGLRFLFTATFNIAIALDTAYFSSVLDAVLIAIAANTATPDGLSCSLETTWSRWFQNKAGAIQYLQNRLLCCGLRSTHDRAFPFPDRTHGAGACVEVYGRRSSCMAGWMSEAQRALTIFMVVGAISLVVKLSIIVVVRLRFGTSVNSGETSDAFRTSTRDGERQRLLGHAVSEEDRAASVEETETAMGERAG